VTESQVDARYASKFASQTVGSLLHREILVPAEELEIFNDHIVGPISLVSALYGDGYEGPKPGPGVLNGTAGEQLPQLERILGYNGANVLLEIRHQRVVVLLNFPY
jgi:hypothetical protein